MEYGVQLRAWRSVFEVDGQRRSTDDIDELITAARQHLKRLKTQKLSRVQKGALADRLLSAKHGNATFAERLGMLLQQGVRPLPTVEVEYHNLTVEADALVGNAGNPSVLNSTIGMLRLATFQRPPTVPHTVLAGVSGVLKPGRMTLLLGPPSSGKSVLLQVLSGRLRPHHGLRVSGTIKYNGVPLDEFQPRRTAGLVQQHDNHIADLSVQETVDFAFRCQVGPQQREAAYLRLEAARHKLADAVAEVAAVETGAAGKAQPAAVDGTGTDTSTAIGQAVQADGAADSSTAGSRGSEGTPHGSDGHGSPTSPDLDDDEAFAEAMQAVIGQRLMPYVILRIMGLSHAAQTLVGSTEARGISGGERKRLTTAEILVGQQPVVFMDEISTGLDSATTYSVIKSFRDVSHALRRTFLISLLQPAPEVIHLFDDILLLTDGRVIYHGPVEGVLPHFEEHLGFVCPPRKDPASFLQEVTTPAGQLLYASPHLLEQHGLSALDSAPAALLAAPPQKLLTSVREMEKEFWGEAPSGQAILHQLEHEPVQPSEAGDHALQKSRYGNNWRVLTRLVVRRQFLLNLRMKTFYIARIVQTTILALIIASLYATINPTPQDGRNAVALLVLTAIYLSMNSAPQMAFAQLSKSAFIKQRENHLFPAWTYSLAQVITQLPQSTVESLCFSLVVYWISGLTRTASNYFIYLLVAWSASNCLAAVFRLVGYLGQTMVLANSYGMLIMLLMMLTNGFSIVRPSIPGYIIWIYWINPLSWAIRALVINELTSPRWQTEVAPGITVGDTIMEPFGFPADKAYIGGAVGFLWGSLIVYTALAALVLQLVQPPQPQPTVPEAEGREETSRNLLNRLQRQLRSQFVAPLNTSLRRMLTSREGKAGAAAASAVAPDVEASPAQLPANGKAATKAWASAAQQPRVAAAAWHGDATEKVAVPFTPIHLVCRDLRYYVADPSKGEAPGVVKDSGDKEIAGKLELLKGISFYARPGELTALMGGSGAGKTTLMDCVLGRKTIGQLRGDILVNGYPKRQDTWSRVCGYVEQQDIHSSRSTVEEALMFSARLRLPGDIPLNKVRQLVEETLEMTELTRLRASVVGDGDGGAGLTIEQRKRLSIAVELVAAPAVMFLDEPTSGLDARAAAIVMRAIQNVARSNRTVMVTIHQPSTEIFESFDMLLLMQLGGRLTYFGPLGFESRELIAYLEGQPGVTTIKPGYNPATWMLEVTGGSMATIYQASHVDFPKVYEASELRKRNDATAEQLVQEGQAAHQPLTVPSQYAATYWTQRRMLLKKFFGIYWRSPHYNFIRLLMTTVIALLYGITYHGQGSISGSASSPANLGNVQNVMGLLFSATIFLGMYNAMSVQPLVAAERIVFYRERAAMMYAPGAYSLALSLAEVPYIIMQSLVMVNLVYWLVDFSHTGWKFAYYWLMYLITMFFYTLAGQFFIVATPNQLMAQLLTASLNQLWTFFNGFLIPYTLIPAGWKWMNRISPTTWILYGLAESQLGDSEVPLVVYGTTVTTVSAFMKSYFDYHFSFIWWCILIMFGYALVFRIGVAVLLQYVSFQRR